MKRIRVLHVIDSLDQGGGQVVLQNLVKHADRERFDISVATMHGHGVCWDSLAALGVPVYSLSPRKWLPLYVPKLLALLLRERFDVVHCHLFGSNWIAKPLAALAGVRVLINHDHCNDRLRYDNPVAFTLDVWTNRLSSHVCAVSASTYDFLIQNEKLPVERVSLIYNGVDLQQFEGLVRNPDTTQPVIVGIGRLHPQKNFPLFLEVAARVLKQHPRATFQIAGSGPEENALRQRAQELGIAAQVKFLGHVSDPRPLYAQASLFLLTSDYEGTPMVILEAMAAGTPIVATALDGISEVLSDGEEATLVERGNAEAFAQQVSALLNYPARADKLATAAQAKVRTRYSAEAMTRNVEAIYLRHLESARGASAVGVAKEPSHIP